MTSDPAVTVDGLGVAYRTPVGSSRWWQPTPTRTVTALHQVDLEIEHGTATGIIGANGAGKTSLLRAIAGIVPPSAGRITVRGDVTAMLSLDVGINPDLTGEENIELGGLARGLTRDQIAARTPEIAEFSGVADVLDQPVRSYSSGMRARLAFAIAVNVDPDILLLDEALSTGDTAFRRASAARMRDLVDQASTILLVSHNLKAITDLCDRAIWLDKGTIIADDTAHDVVRAYRRHLDQGAQS